MSVFVIYIYIYNMFIFLCVAYIFKVVYYIYILLSVIYLFIFHFCFPACLANSGVEIQCVRKCQID